MQELLQVAIAPVNIVFTLLLITVLMYWLSVIIGALDIGSLDFDLDLDTDVDMDIDVDADADVDTGSGSSFFGSALHFFNFGKLPFMIIMSLLILFMWAFSILSNYYIGEGSIAFALAMFIPNLFISLLLTKFISSPLIPVFEDMDAGAKPIDYIGQVCTLRLPLRPAALGQAEVNLDGNVLLITVKSDEHNQVELQKGEQVLITGQSPDHKYFIVQKTQI